MRALRALGLYTVLTIALTWPFAANLHVMDAGDSAFFAWEIGWTVHALKTDPAQLPHANIFWPLRYTLGMDEPVLGTTLLGLPLAPFTDDAVLLYNVIRLLTFLASALAAYALARELRAAEPAALLAGALFAFSPIRTDQVAHLSTLGTQWWPLALLFTVRFARRNRARDALLAALFFVLGFLACGYHGVLAAAVLPPALAVLFWGRWDRLKAGILAAALAALALTPVYVMHQRALAPEHYARGTEETIQYSAPVEAFLATSAWNRVWGPATDAFRTVGPNNLFPGLVPPLVVLAAALALVRRRERPGREAAALAVLLLAAALVALGPRIRLFSHDLGPGPWALLRETVPLFQMIRVTSRAGVFLALPLVMLAAMALTRLRPRPLVLAGIASVALLETLIVPVPLPRRTMQVDTRRAPEVYRWLAKQPGREPIVELPIYDVYALERRPAFHDSVYMVYSTLHWKPLVNGYAGIEPRSYVELRELSRGFPSDERFYEALRAIGVRTLIVHRKGYGPFQWERLQPELPAALAGPLRDVATFGNDVVYELQPAVR